MWAVNLSRNDPRRMLEEGAQVDQILPNIVLPRYYFLRIPERTQQLCVRRVEENRKRWGLEKTVWRGKKQDAVEPRILPPGLRHTP